MKRRLAALMAVLLVASMALSACGGKEEASESGGETDGGALTLRLGHVVADESSLDKGLDKFAELVSEKSDGAIKVEIYPNSALGDNTALAEQLQMGSLDLAAPSVGAIGGFSKSVALFDMPYLFKNAEAAEEVFDGEIGQSIADELEPSGFTVLAWMTQSWRHVTCNKEVHKPEDLKGLKIRTMDSEYHMMNFNTVGASATPMAFSEVYTALQQGTIDAQENPYTNIVTSRFYEVQDYVIETAHIYDPCPLLLSNVTKDKLTEDQMAVLQEAATEALAWEREEIVKDDEAYRKTVEDSGTKVIQLTEEERNVFREAAQPVYDAYIAAEGEKAEQMIEQVEAINEKH